MSRRLPVPTAPGPLESYASSFDDLFNKRNQRDTFRRYLEGLLPGQSGLVRKAMSKGNLGPTIEFVPVSTAFLGFSVHHASSNRSYSPPSRPTPDR